VAFQGISSTGGCTTDDNTKYFKLPFLQNTTISCKIPTAVLDFTTLDSTKCSTAALTALKTLSIQNLWNPSIYIGTWGQSTVTSLGDWQTASNYTDISTDSVIYNSTGNYCT